MVFSGPGVGSEPAARFPGMEAAHNRGECKSGATEEVACAAFLLLERCRNMPHQMLGFEFR